MSTDFSAVCHHCKVVWHLGQDGGRFTSAYGTKDEEGQNGVGLLLMEHVIHGGQIIYDDPTALDLLDQGYLEKDIHKR